LDLSGIGLKKIGGGETKSEGISALELSRGKTGDGSIGGLRMRGKIAPGRDERGLLGKTIVEQHRELLRLQRVNPRVGLRCGPPLKPSLAEATDTTPKTDAIVTKDF
jgi:hypothetical protein